MKNRIKTIASLFLLLICLLVLQPCGAYAAAGDAVIVTLGAGKSSAVVRQGSGARIVSLNKEATAQSLLNVPLAAEETVYVPLYDTLRLMGFNVSLNKNTGAASIQGRDGFSFWTDSGTGGAEKVDAAKIILENGSYTLSQEDSRDTVDMEAPVRTVLNTLYISIEEFARFNVLAYWDKDANVIHLISNTAEDFDEALLRYFSEPDSESRAALTASYYNGMEKDESFTAAYDQFMSAVTGNNNPMNNALALKTSGQLYLSLVKNNKISEYTAVSTDARQLTYAELNGTKLIYFVSHADKQIYKVELAENGQASAPVKLALPNELGGKKFSQLIADNDRLFFIAYDDKQNGGQVYMAQVGNEGKALIKITADRVWNILLSADYKLYYTDFDKNYALHCIDLKDPGTLETLSKNKQAGKDGAMVNSAGVQSAVFSKQRPGTYYYSDINTGHIMKAEITPGGFSTIAPEPLVKAESGTGLYNFLNLCEADGRENLYFIYYKNGRNGGFDTCQIMVCDLSTGKTRVLYPSNGPSEKMLMQLTVADNALYFTNGEYSELYRLDFSDGLHYIYRNMSH